MLRILRFVMFASLLMAGMGSPMASAQTAAELLTPKAPPKPQIHGPKIYGARPGHPFLYRIPCTGSRPIHFSITGLPSSLKLDASTGIISGQTPQTRGEFVLTIEATNRYGKTTRPFKVVVGDSLGLTPQMGWNGWYTLYDHPTDAGIRAAADTMIASGMADYGYNFVDIDDAWMRKPGSADPALSGPVRDKNGDILPNRNFPGMNSLTDYLHFLGLKAGIYTSPGPLTCASYEGAYQHEEADARTFARWGFDLLKYDMCSYGKLIKEKTLEEYQKPYFQMGRLLQAQDRDIVLNMCQYGVADVWKWGRESGGNSWRTTGDLGVVPNKELPGFYAIALSNAAHDAYAGPGGWNDPDYILIGSVGDAINSEHPVKKTTLTPDEQYSYMSLWSLMAAPLFFSGDMTNLDEQTLNVLCNSEVIDIDQDSLGKQGHILRKTEKELILARPLEDGSLAVGLFNLANLPGSITVDWQAMGRTGQQTVRDVWRQKDMGAFKDTYTAQVPAHGVVLVRLIALRG